MSDFVKRLNQLMEDKNISQNKLAEMTGITQSSISDWANGKYKPRQDKVYLLSEALKVSPAYLLGYTDNKNLDQHISTAENENLNMLFNKLNDEGKDKVLNYTQDLVDSGKYSIKVKEDNISYMPSTEEMLDYLKEIPMAAFDGKLDIYKMPEDELYTLYKLIKDNE